MALKEVYEPRQALAGWFDPTAKIEGWFDEYATYGTKIFPVGQGVTTLWTAATTAYNVTAPTALTENDMLVVQFVNAAASGSFSTVPTGWTAAIAPTFVSGGNMLSVYYHFVTAAEAAAPPASFNFIWNASLTGNALLMAYRNVSVSNPFDVTVVSPVNSGGTVTDTVASVTTVTDKAFVIGGAMLQSAVTQSVAGPANGWTQTLSSCTLSAGRGGIVGYQGEKTPLGATGSIVFTQTAALNGLAYSIALRPSPAYFKTLTAGLGFNGPFLSVEDQGFEGGTVGGWYHAGSHGALSNSSAQAHSGTKSLLMSYGTGATFSEGANSPALTTVVGQSYTISGWVYIPAGMPSTYIGAYFVASGPIITATGVWTFTSLTFTATQTTSWITFGQFGASVPGDLLYIDDVSIQDATLTRSVGKKMSGVLSFVGNLASTLMGAGGTAYNQALTATLSFTGSQKRAVGKNVTATLSFTGAVKRSVVKRLSAVLSFTGSQSRALLKKLTGGLSFTGSQARSVGKKLTAGLSFVGNLATSYMTGAGTAYFKAFTASLDFSGTVSKSISTRFTSFLGFVGGLLAPAPVRPTYRFVGPIISYGLDVSRHGDVRWIGSVGRTVVRCDGVWSIVENPVQSFLDSCDRVYRGGYSYQGLSQDLATELIDAGFGAYLTQEK